LAHADVGWENADTSGQITDAGQDRDASGGGIAREFGSSTVAMKSTILTKLSRLSAEVMPSAAPADRT
jgi:hypothetical protein